VDPKRKRKILIVDDDQTVGALFVHTLEPGGFNVVAVEDPDEGIETAKQIEPEIIYLSLLFPESNGLKVAKLLHSVERLKEIPIVVLISYHGELDPKYTKTIGIVDVLVKPLKSADVLAMTAKLLGEEISRAAGEPPGLFREGEEEPGAGEEADLLLRRSSSESMSEESKVRLGSAGEEIVEETRKVEGADRQLGQAGESAGERDWSSPDFAAGEKEDSGEEGILPHVVAAKKDDDIRSLLAEGESSPGDAEEEGNTDDGPDFEGRQGAKNRPARKYVLFVALTLLVAAIVFAALQAGILPGGNPAGKLPPEVVKETPVRKGTVREIVQPGKVEDRRNAGDVHSLQKNPAEKGISASQASAERKERPAAGRPVKPLLQKEPKALNEGLKEPKALKAQRKEVYSVQLGVFAKEGNAVSFAEKLKERGYDAFVEKGHGAGLHRVLVGRFDDYRKARRQSEVLLQKDGIKSIIYRH
jgi:CheY-like chemotaxis protein/cell division septation protein DedD